MKLFGQLSELTKTVFRKNSQNIELKPNSSTTYTATRSIELPNGDASHVLVSASSTQVLTGKSIDGDDNTLTDIGLASLKTVIGDANEALVRDGSGAVVSAAIVNANISASAAIARNKLATGSNGHVVVNDGSGVMTSEAALTSSRGGLGTDASAFTGVVKASAGSFSAATIVNADVAASAAIDATKIADGSVTNAEFQRLDATSSIQGQLDGKQPLDADLTAVAALSSTGFATRTASNTWAQRSLDAGSSKVSISNPAGVAGNPSIDVVEANLTLDNIGGTLSISKGGTGQTSKTPAFDALAPSTTKGDLIAYDGSDNIRVAVGTNGQVLTADSTQASGLNWTSPLVNPMDSAGDMIYGGTGGAATKLDSGTSGAVLRSGGAAAPVWDTNLSVNASTGVLTAGPTTGTNIHTFQGATAIVQASSNGSNASAFRFSESGTYKAQIAYTDSTEVTSFETTTTGAVGSYTQAGLWSVGPTSFTGAHTLNGRITASSSQSGANAISSFKNTGAAPSSYELVVGANRTTAGAVSVLTLENTVESTNCQVLANRQGATALGLTFRTFNGGSIDAMTLSAAGALSAGTSTLTTNHVAMAGESTQVMVVESSAATASSTRRCLDARFQVDTDCTGGYFFSCLNSSSTVIGRIEAASNTTTSFVGSSDSRLKQASSGFNGIPLIMSMAPKEYEWKSNPGKRQKGFYAQELYEVYPDAVSVGSDALTEDGSLALPWGIDYSRLTPVLVKAIQEQQLVLQEQQTTIAALQARIEALES